MDSYTVMVMDNPLAPVRRYQVPKVLVRRAAWIAVACFVALSAAVWDYWRVRADNSELAALRLVTAEQRQQIQLFDTTLGSVEAELARVKEFERKVRIIANLPGAAAIGGEDVFELAPIGDGIIAPPIGVPVDRTPPSTGTPGGQGGGIPSLIEETESSAAAVFGKLDDQAVVLSEGAVVRAGSLDVLLEQLEDKRERLVSMPSVWPSKGWMTSTFGTRVSPFTGRRQRHNGIDIAAADGTPIFAPARGRVIVAGRKGPLGNALVLDHGFGVKTVYGHTKQILVATGDTVERGDKVAEIGSSGRSTGPHLHYVVEVRGKPRNPLDYIFD